MQTMGEKIKELRKEKGVSQEETAYELGVSRQTINKWESNAMQPSTESISALCKYFGVKPDYFFSDSQVMDEAAAAEVQAKGKKVPFIICLVLLIVCSLAFIVLAFSTLWTGLNAFSDNVGYERISTAVITQKGIFIGCLIGSIIMLCADAVLAFLLKKFKK